MDRLNRSKPLWLILLVGALLLEVAALFFQYVLDYGPCILCVQIRAVLLVVILLATVALALPSMARLAAVLLIPCSVTFAWFCYQVLGIERGWFEGSCTFEPPFPAWIPLHEWFPSVFEAWELCGYTPEILFGVTMAETLILVAVVTLILNAALIIKSR